MFNSCKSTLRMQVTLISWVILFSVACSTRKDCDTIGVPGVIATVDGGIDCDYVVKASSSTGYVEQLVPLEASAANCRFSGLYERPGIYILSVEVGSITTETRRVDVRRADCHVETVRITFDA
jgi:hypothetical protein